MRLQILNRIRQGNPIVAEVDNPKSGFRKWIWVRAGRPDSGSRFLIEISEQPEFGQAYYFYEKTDYKIIERIEAPDEAELLGKLSELCGDTDIFDVPWKVYTPVRGKPVELEDKLF